MNNLQEVAYQTQTALLDEMSIETLEKAISTFGAVLADPSLGDKARLVVSATIVRAKSVLDRKKNNRLLLWGGAGLAAWFLFLR